MLDRYFLTGSTYAAIWAQHDGPMVALSAFTAVFASIIAMQLASLARRSESRRTRAIARASGALALGGGVWAMHFIGMLAFDVCAHGSIAPVTTAVSMLPSVLASWVALGFLSRRQITAPTLAVCGVLVGAGIGTMHYIGMAASQWAPVMRYDPGIFVASVLVAVGMAMLALWVRFGLERVVQWPPLLLNAVAGTVMGLAITGMHYTGMAALRFTYVPPTDQVVNTTPLALGIAAVMVGISLLVVAINAGFVYWRLFRRLRQSESRQRAIADTAVDGMVVFDAHGTIQTFSAAAQRILGWSEAEATGHRFDRLLHEHDRALLAAHLRRDRWGPDEAMLGGAGHEVSAFHADGSTVPVRISLGRVELDGDPMFVAFIADQRYRHALQRELERTVFALDRALAVIEFDLDGRVLTANDNYLALMGYRLEEVVGQHHRLFCDPTFVESADYARFWAQLQSGELDGGEYLRVGKGGRQVWIQATYTPMLDAAGKPVKVVKFASDLTERRQMEQELRAAKERAEQAAAARSTFLANMSHEIRTPMNAIIGFTDVLLTSALDAQQRRQLGTVNHAARSMLRLLNAILDTAKLEKGAVDLEIADFSLDEVCEQMLASLRIQAQRKGLQVAYAPGAAVPPHLRGDSLRLQQILLNLLGNAIKFTERGQVTLRTDYVDGVLIAEVIDTGIGIPASQLARIFDPFAQADASTTRKFGGTGLGTTIARQLCELMGGTIAVQSTPGAGSTFTVRIPLAAGEPVDPTVPVDVAGLLPPLRVLAVDDVAHNLELLEHHLQRGGHTVVLASDGEEAIARVMAERFDVVLMDLQMPGMDGLEATRRIRAFEQARGSTPVPIIALSASVLEQDRRNARAAGMDGFANKPLEPDRLFREIGRQLGVEGLPPSGSYPRVELPDEVDARLDEATIVIDWERAYQLWDDRDTYRRAGRRLLAELPTVTAAFAEPPTQASLGALRTTAHRVRGAAANLGFVALASLAHRIEQAAQREDLLAAASGCERWSDVVRATRDAFDRRAADREADREADRAADRAAGAGTPLDADAHRRANAALQQLAAGFARAELDDAALAALADVLPPAALAPLHDAIDLFDFDSAQTAAAALREALPAVGVGT